MNNSSDIWYFEPLPYCECVDRITWLTVMMMESVAIVTLNLVTIIIFIKIRSLRRRAMYLVINLAVADMFVGGFSEVIFFHEFGLTPWKYNVAKMWRDVFFGMRSLFLAASITNIVAISLERMHATFFPWRHRVIKKRIYMVTIAIVWVLAAGAVIIWLMLERYGNPSSISVYFLNSSGCFCLFIICISYASIVVKIYCGAHPRHHGAARRERKLTVTLFIMTLVSLLTLLPLYIWTIWQLYVMNVFDHSCIASSSCLFPVTGNWAFINIATSVLMFANSLVNPILYAIRMPEFKRALVSIFLCRPQQRQVVLPPRVM